MPKNNMLVRCGWCSDDPIYVAYHDQEWGVPIYDDQQLFEFLVLEGMQAGLSWITILKRREAYRKAFANFDANKIARFSEAKINRLLQDPSIIRNRLKVLSIVNNAKAYLAIREHGSFTDFLWQFVDGAPIQNRWQTLQAVPANTIQSDQMARALKQKQFKFIGTTICYAFMQAVGMVNDHLVDCFRHSALFAEHNVG